MIGRYAWKILAADMKNKTKPGKTTGQVTYRLIPLLWEQLWDSVRHDKLCWLQGPHGLLLHAILSYDMDGIQKDLYLFKIKQKIIFSWLVNITHSILMIMQICMLLLNFYVFEKKNKRPDTNTPGDPDSQNWYKFKIIFVMKYIYLYTLV